MLDVGPAQCLHPPFLSVLVRLSVRDSTRLGCASRSLHGTVNEGIHLAVLPQHADLGLGPWPRCCWLQVIATREEAILEERFGADWESRWLARGSPEYCMVRPIAGASGDFRALSMGPRRGHTLRPGSGLLWRLPVPLRPTKVTWLARAEGVAAGGDGRIGCISLLERPGLELLRVYFNSGGLWWEKSGADPIALLPRGSVGDSQWYHVRCCLNWTSRTADVRVFLLCDEQPLQKLRSYAGLGWHSDGCTALAQVSVYSAVFASSPLSSSQAYLADLCFS